MAKDWLDEGLNDEERQRLLELDLGQVVAMVDELAKLLNDPEALENRLLDRVAGVVSALMLKAPQNMHALIAGVAVVRLAEQRREAAE